MAEEKQSGMPRPGGNPEQTQVEIDLGLLLRDAYRAYSRALNSRLADHGVTIGQWFFLRALWELDGLTQRELSYRVGMMEPTTVTAIQGMERRGLVRRVRNPSDRRKMNVFLTDRGRELQGVLMPFNAEVTVLAVAGLLGDDLRRMAHALRTVTSNLDEGTAGDDHSLE